MGCIHKSPNTTEQNEKILFSLLELANKSISNNDKISIMGDFNYPSIKWNGILTHDRDFEFVEAIRDAYLYQMATKPTRSRLGQTANITDLVQVPLHFNFMDFKSAFDTVWRKALWRMMIAIGVDTKIVNIIEALYKDTECAIVIDGHITEWFKVNIGVLQGCIFSPTLFNIFLEFVMKEQKSLDLQMKNTLSVDIRYADDTTLISTVFNKLKISSGELEEACRKWGMKINRGKCKIISTSTDSIKIDGKNVDHVEEFVFLGSVVPDTSADVMRRIALAASAFGRLQKVIWDRHDISNHLKICLYNALILPIATYASETWTLKSEDTRKLTVFEMRCLRSILGTTLADRIRNTDIITRSGIRHTIIDHIKTRRLSWFGHVVRRPEDSYVYKAYKDDFTQARPKGRPPKRWSAQIREDTGLPLLTLERRAPNRGRWRGDVRLVNARGLRKA